MGRACGFNKLEPRYPDVGTVDQRHERFRLENVVRTSFVGLGFEDLLNSHMISEEGNYERMDVEVGSDYLGDSEPTSITELHNEDYTMLRMWVLSSLTVVPEDDTHWAYPQDLAEIGHVAHRDDDENARVAEARRVTAVLARHDMTCKDVKARLAALYRDFDTNLEMPAADHPSFIDDRTTAIAIDGEKIDVVGELHPKAVVKHDLRLPVAALEFDLSTLA